MTVRSTRLAFRSNISLAALFLLPLSIHAQLVDGPGKAEAEKLCRQCHDLAKSVSLRQDRTGWEATMNKMIAFGMKGSKADFEAILEYLVKNYPADALPPLLINKALAIDIESALSMKRSEAAAIIRYRTEKGPFKNLAELKKVPGIDVSKIESKKDRIVF